MEIIVFLILVIFLSLGIYSNIYSIASEKKDMKSMKLAVRNQQESIERLKYSIDLKEKIVEITKEKIILQKEINELLCALIAKLDRQL
jgi:hypothetical protein